MTLLILGLACAFFSAVFIAMFRVYQEIPAQELKRRARRGDEVANLLYKAGAYGEKTTLLLVSLAVAFAYAGVLLLESGLGTTKTAILVLVLMAVIGRFVVGKGGVSKSAVWLTSKLSSPLAWTLERLHPIVEWLNSWIRKVAPVGNGSRVFEKQDIIQLLEKQKTQPENRISEGEINLLTHALSFGDKTVADALVPKRVVISAGEHEDVGPILMNRLHKSGHSRFPVFEGASDNITGLLYLHDLIEHKSGGRVADIMRRKVTYVHESFTLYQTLQAFIKTKQHLFIVVNSLEEYVGIITIEDVLEQVIGKLIVDEFDEYEDLRAVAASEAKKIHTKQQKNHAETNSDETEVI